MKYQHEETEYHYDFVANNPHMSDLNKMYDNGIRLKKQQEGIYYLSASFITHEQARHYCKSFGLAVVKFKKVHSLVNDKQMATSCNI